MPFRSALEKSLSAYISNHYPGGTCAVFCSSRPLSKAAPSAPISAAAEQEEEVAVTEPGATEPATVADVADIVPQESHEEALESKDKERFIASETKEEHVPTESPQEHADQNVEATSSDLKELGSGDSEPKAGDASAVPTEEPEKEEETDSASGKIGEAIAGEESPPKTAQLQETQAHPVDQKESEPPTAVQETEEPEDHPVFTIQIVANKYNVPNFW